MEGSIHDLQGRSPQEQLHSQCLHPQNKELEYTDKSRSPGSLPADVIEDGINMYFEHFHAQPYKLLCQATTMRTIASISPVVLNPMLALSIRCSSHPFWADQSKLNSWQQALTEKAWKDLLQLYGDGETGLQYLQGLCLLVQVDFAGMSKHSNLLCYLDCVLLFVIDRWTCKTSPFSTLTGHQNRPVLRISN